MIVAESGFGTGLNFLTLWQAFDVFVRDNPDVTLQRLHFISFEKYPLKAEDLRLAHQRWPELAPWAQQLQAQWPSAFGGVPSSAARRRAGDARSVVWRYQ